MNKKINKFSNFLTENNNNSYFPEKDVIKADAQFPDTILIETTNMCNHACTFCSNKMMSRKKGQIRIELVESIIKQARELGVKRIGLYSTGEPFLFKKLSEAVCLAKKAGIEYVYLTTNGALADPDTMTTLIKNGLDSIKFSINAATRETYKKIHGRDNFAAVIKNLEFIKTYRDRHNIPMSIGVSYIVMDANKDEVEHAKKLFGDLSDEFVVSSLTSQGGYMNELKAPPIATMPCCMVFNRFHVSCEGYYTLCCADFQNYLAVADLNNIPLKDAWNHPAAVEMRKRHLEKRVEGTLCYNCSTGKSVEVKPLNEKLATIFCFKK